MKRVITLALMILGFAACPTLGWGGSKCDQSNEKPCDVTLGRPRVWGYDRLYPLLDGLFQDVSATQLAQLTLNPNAANAASLDAVQSAFQAGASFSQTLGANNALAQQLNSVLSTNASLQNELLSRQAQLVQAALTAQQQVGSAQASVDQLSQSPNATDSQKAVAKQALTAATDNLTSINNQLSLVKSQVSSNLGSVQQLQAPSTSAQSSPPTLPSSLLNLTAPPNAPAPPSFPSSKQMDNQINLLWERLARLTSTLAQPDSLKGYMIDLVEINIGATPVHRKKKLLGVEYAVSCGDTPVVKYRDKPVSSDDPVVLDLFPSASTVNIVDTKYRENRIGLAAVLSWFTVGINAAYNRDHLRMTQSLGQSGYITGYGVGTRKFGWILGRNLGDDTLTPGERTVFALVASPSTCKKLSVMATKAGWFEAQRDQWYRYRMDDNNQLIDRNDFCPMTGQQYDASCPVSPATPKNTNTIRSISYAPADFDPAAPTKSLVSLEIGTSEPIDSQQVVSINGKIIKRSRDSFGRGVGSGGSGGLLETATVDPNSWLPTASTRFTLTLDPSSFGRIFPEIEIDSPSGPLTVKEFLNGSGEKTVDIAGRGFFCGPTCLADLPALGYPNTTTKQLLVSRWDRKSPNKNKLLITVSGDQAGSSSTTAGGGVPTLQIFSAGDQTPWGSQSVVLASFDGPEKIFRLSCSPAGSRLICDQPQDDPKDDLKFDRVTIQVIDPDHIGGGIKGSKRYEFRGHLSPLIWQIDQPQWTRVDPEKDPAPKTPECAKAPKPLSKADGALRLTLRMEIINLQDDHNVTLFGGPLNKEAVTMGVCSSENTTPDRCSLSLTIPESQFQNVTDQMVLLFGSPCDESGQASVASLRYLRSNAQPVVTGLNDAQTIMTGQNLFFTQLRVGDSSNRIQLKCDNNGSECRIDPNQKNPFGKDQGFLTFLDDKVAIEAIQLKGGTASAIFHSAPAPAGTATAQAAPPAPSVVINQNFSQTLGNIGKMMQAAQ